MFSLVFEVAVVMGSGSGKAIAQVLARQGATGYLLERNVEAAKTTASSRSSPKFPLLS